MELKLVNVGIFWAVLSTADSGWSFYEVKKSYPVSSANSLGFIDYPYSHYEKWDDVRSASETHDCYYYPRGRVIYDTNRNKHRIFADECLSECDLREIIELFEIDDFELCRDEHYVSTFTRKHNQVNDAPALTCNVLRGKDKIGENLIEITYGDTKLLVELGKALDGGGELSDMEKRVLKTPYNAVIVSHYHADHAGLIGYKKDCPVYMGSGAYRIIKAMSEYHGKVLANNIATYHNGKTFTVGGIKITPFLCDHSAFDSYMLLFEAGGKSILYTGDFRFHGRKDKYKLLSRLPRRVNTLICEGTNVGNTKPCFSESELEDKLVEIMRQNEKPVFVLQSGTNIDRLVSVYRAAKRSGRILYEDNYSALIASAAGGKIPRPDVFDDVYAFTPRRLYGKRKDMFFEIENKRGLKGIAGGKKFVMIVRPSMLNYIEKLYNKVYLPGAMLVYSIWNGYKEDTETAEFLMRATDMFMNIIDLHTSGHASAEDIELLKQTVGADEYISVHTRPAESGSLAARSIPEGGDEYAFLREKVYEGLCEKFADITAELAERTEYELNIIKELALTDYFLIVWDAVRYAKSVNIPVGPGRGNIAGSLVSYALGITDVNPIKYSLTAERYWNGKNREIAIDFCFERQGEIFEFLTEKYGAEHVTHVGLYPKKSQEVRMHAAAIALCNQPIENILLLTKTKDSVTVTDCDTEKCRDAGLHILHALGWNKLTQIRKTTELIKRRKHINIDFSDTVFGYDDPKVFALISSGKTDGVFGLESDIVQDFMRKFHPKSIEELVAGISLFELQTRQDERAQKFIQGADLCAMDKEEVITLYNRVADSKRPVIICKPHEICYYGYLTYRTAYLKCYYPEEYEEVIRQR